MTRLDVGSEAIVIGSKWSYLYLYITSMTNFRYKHFYRFQNNWSKDLNIHIMEGKVEWILFSVYGRKSTRYHSYWILFEYMFSKVWGLRINLILLPRSAKKENLFLCTGKFFFNWSSKIKKKSISLMKERVLINSFFLTYASIFEVSTILLYIIVFQRTNLYCFLLRWTTLIVF